MNFKPLTEKRRVALLKKFGWQPPSRMTQDAIDRALLTREWNEREGIVPVDPDDEGSPIHCSSEYHFARMTGPGAPLVPLLYAVAFRVSKESGEFFVSIARIAKYLNVSDDALHEAAALLVRTGFFEVKEKEIGKAAHYRPVPHEEWAKHFKKEEDDEKEVGWACTKKWEFPHKDEDTLADLGRKLHGILGGEKFFRNVLLGYRNAAAFTDEARADEFVIDVAKKYMVGKPAPSGIERRKDFRRFLLEERDRVRLD